LAKLTKDLLTHCEKHKVMELRYEEQAGKRRLYFHNWLTRIAAVIKMFSHTAPVLNAENDVIEFMDPTGIGNQALNLLLCSKVDNFYRNLIQRHQDRGDKALALLQSYCASCTIVDKNHFHHEFTNLRLQNEETATHFLKRFTIARTKAIIADNIYSEEEVVDLFLAAFTQTTNMPYMYITQHFMPMRQSGTAVAFHEIEKRLMAIDESTKRARFVSRKSRVALGLVAHEVPPSEQANVAQQRTIKCYSCGKEGHISKHCPEATRQQANQASTGRQRGGRGRGRGRGRQPARQTQQANQSQVQAEPTTIVHGCSARVLELGTSSSSSTYHSTSPSPISL
jgi:hypothetical protein